LLIIYYLYYFVEKNNRIDDGHFFEFLFLLFFKEKIQTSAFAEFTESFLQYLLYKPTEKIFQMN